MTLAKWSSSDEEVFLNFLIFQKRGTKGHYHTLTQEMSKSDRESFFKSVTLLYIKNTIPFVGPWKNQKNCFLMFSESMKSNWQKCRAVGKGGRGRRQPPTISWSKIVFPRKIGNHKIFTGEEYMRLESIYWTRHKWQKVGSFFWIWRFSSKLSYQLPTTSL